MAGQPPSFPSGFPTAQQQAMINQFGSGQMVPELMSPQQGGMPSGLVNPQQFGAGMGGNVGVVGSNPMAQQVMTQQRQQLAQQALMQQQRQQMQHQQLQLQQQKQQQQAALVPQNSQVINQAQTPQASVSQVQQQPQPQQPKPQISPVSLCKTGQETVHDITSRVSDVFKILQNIQPPNGTHQGNVLATERQKKMNETLDCIYALFKHLRRVYDACNENSQLQGLEYTHIESLIPFKEEWDMKSDEKKTSEVYRLACEERNKLIEQVTMKNRHLKEIIDHIRLIISEINIMLHMRRT